MIYNLCMKIAGLVAEFNPLHYGHEYIINKIKEDNVDLLIAAMSPNFTMRGEPAIFNKFIRTEIALNKGIDIIAEIPTIYTIESADIYAYRSIEILNKLEITDLYFGVENINESLFYDLIKELEKDIYKELLNKYLKEGYSFNTSFKKALTELDNKYNQVIDSPNNLLAIHYLVSINKINKNIKAHFIKRIDAEYYGSIDSNKLIQSASAIRKELLNGNKTNYLSYSCKNFISHVKNDYFDLLKYRIMSMTKEDLKNIQGISEGLENKIKSIKNIDSYESLVESLVSKRNRETKINRILMCILLNIKKDEVTSSNLTYVRVLGFNTNGQKYLGKINNNEVVTTIKKDLDNGIYRELDFTKIYSLNKEENLELKEYSPIIYKN